MCAQARTRAQSELAVVPPPPPKVARVLPKARLPALIAGLAELVCDQVCITNALQMLRAHKRLGKRRCVARLASAALAVLTVAVGRSFALEYHVLRQVIVGELTNQTGLTRFFNAGRGDAHTRDHTVWPMAHPTACSRAQPASRPVWQRQCSLPLL